VLNQSRAIEPVVRRAAPDVRRPQRLDGGLHHVHGIAADRGGGQWRRKVGGTGGATPAPSAPPSPLPPPPSYGDAEHRAHARARIAAWIPEPPSPAILEAIAQFHAQRQPSQRSPFHASAHTPLGRELLGRGIGPQTELHAGARIGAE